MKWTFEDYKAWKQYKKQHGRMELEDRLRVDMQAYGMQSRLELLCELVLRMNFDEDAQVMQGRQKRTYAEACQELHDCLSSMKIDEEKKYADIR